MRLSLILPCYNVSRFIDQCVESIENQDLDRKEYEIICVNDCSTDDTYSHLLEFQRKYDNVIIKQHEVNLGSAGARNTGLAIASGEYVWFIDPDDYLVTNCFSDLLSRAESNNLDIALFNNYVIDYEDKETRIKHERYIETEVLSGRDFLEKYDSRNLSKNSIVWLQLYKRSFLLSIDAKYPLVRLNDDALFSWKTLLQAERVQSASDFLYVFRSNPFSITGSKPTASKVYAKCVQGPIEINSWLSLPFIDEGIRRELESICRSYVSSLLAEYSHLDAEEQYSLYQLLFRNRLAIRSLRKYFGRKSGLVFMSLPLGKSVFDSLIAILKR